MIKRLTRLFTSTSASPTPQTRIVGGGSDDNPHARIGWTDKTDRRKKIRRWMEKYRRGGPYADAVDAYWLFALSNGWQLACEKGAEPMKARVQAWLDQPHVDLDEIMKLAILSAKIAGDAYQEIVLNRGGDVWGVVTRDPSSFRKKWDTYGRITGYEQIIGDERTGSQTIPIKKDAILNLILDQLPGDVYGLSVWERAEDDIERDCDIIESTTKAIHRHGTPKQQWKVGDAATRASAADLKAVEKEIRTINAKTDFATGHDVEVVMLDTAGVANVDTYSNVSLQRTACALGVPEEMLGLGRGSTEATATVRMQAFLGKISTLQAIVARTYSRGLIDRITGVPGKVWLEFNDVSPDDEAKIADWIAKMRQSSPLDPDAIVPAAWARGRLGVPPDENAAPDGGEPEIPGEVAE